MLEASAGTGKTYTIAALAARYVAEGTPLDELLLVTFTRMATGELRDRVRERLVSAEQGLDRDARAASRADRRRVVALLRRRQPRTRSRARRDRLAAALADFDAATIATTHGFCQEVLGGLGVAGDVERDAAFVEDVSDLVDEVVDDLYVRALPPAAATRLVSPRRGAEDRPRGRRQPGRADRARRRRRPATAAMRGRLADAVRDELDRRKRRPRLMTYDDLLTRLDATLRGERRRRRGRAAARALRVVLVDEFQDTDPVQWEIVRRAFGDGDDDARAHRRPQAGDLRLPRRRRLRLPRRRRGGRHARDAATSTGAATRACSTPTTRSSAAPSSATRASSTATVRAADGAPSRRA